jgi:large subunit ribosomal protein L10
MKANKKIPQWKSEFVSSIAEKIASYSVAGVLDISGLPAAQFQRIRHRLKGQAEIVVGKNTLFHISLQRAAGHKGEKILDLSKFLRGQTALILTNLNPFKLSKILDESKTSAPAKPGMISPKDITIPAGETEFSPGPVVGELQRVGVKARIQAGKVVILEDSPILKQGDIISKEIADVLGKLNIHPIELGLKLIAAYEGGIIYSGEMLKIDEAKVLSQIQGAYTNALYLSLNVCYPTRANIGTLLMKARVSALNLAINAKIFTSEVAPMLLSRSAAEMLSLARAICASDERALDEDLKRMIAIAPSPKEGEGKAEKPKEEKVEKEEEMAGLGTLFG